MSVNEDGESSSLVAGLIYSLCITSKRIDLMFKWKKTFFISFS